MNKREERSNSFCSIHYTQCYLPPECTKFVSKMFTRTVAISVFAGMATPTAKGWAAGSGGGRGRSSWKTTTRTCAFLLYSLFICMLNIYRATNVAAAGASVPFRTAENAITRLAAKIKNGRKMASNRARGGTTGKRTGHLWHPFLPFSLWAR